MTLEVSVIGFGLLGPGLVDGATALALLRDPAAWRREPTVVPPPQRLPSTERRRAGTVIKASIDVADQALLGTGTDPATLPTVFTSSTGDPLNCHVLCEALAAPERMMSPTRFTNSVHNAPAGYWHIVTASQAASTSLAGFDASFAVGLLEAAVQCHATRGPVLLVACDVPYPAPMHSVRPVADTFAAALLLSPSGGRSIRLELTSETGSTPCVHPGLEQVRLTIPAARALPLLVALAGDTAVSLLLEGHSDEGLRVQVATR